MKAQKKRQKAAARRAALQEMQCGGKAGEQAKGNAKVCLSI